jgi:hypothetical protein
MPLAPIHLQLAIFEGPLDRVRSSKVLLWFMEALVQTNLLWLGEHVDAPALYKSHVKYQSENGTENWKDIPNILRDGVGDCEDLSCWRTAELRYAGINAHPFVRWRKQADTYIYHALTRWPDGRIEDASLAMGMRGGVMHRKAMFIAPEGTG